MSSLQNNNIWKELVEISEHAGETIVGGCYNSGPIAGGPPPIFKNPWDDLGSPNIAMTNPNTIMGMA